MMRFLDMLIHRQPFEKGDDPVTLQMEAAKARADLAVSAHQEVIREVLDQNEILRNRNAVDRRSR